MLKKFLLLYIVISCSIVLLFGPASSEQKSFQFKKQPEIQQIKPKKPVKIKLKRSGEGKYTWELSGDDVDEIVKIDRKLKNLLKVE